MLSALAWLGEHWTEVVGLVTGALCVLLAARRNIGYLPIGIANNLVFIVLFVGAALYADAGLHVIYLVLGTDAKRIRFGSILKLKGIETGAVAITDVGPEARSWAEQHDLDWNDLLYVALSRARYDAVVLEAASQS